MLLNLTYCLAQIVPVDFPAGPVGILVWLDAQRQSPADLESTTGHTPRGKSLAWNACSPRHGPLLPDPLLLGASAPSPIVDPLMLISIMRSYGPWCPGYIRTLVTSQCIWLWRRNDGNWWCCWFNVFMSNCHYQTNPSTYSSPRTSHSSPFPPNLCVYAHQHAITHLP